MPKFDKASSFSLFSLDHDRVLLDSEVHSSRRLLNDDFMNTPKQLKLSFTLDGVTRESVLTRARGAFAENAKVTVVNAEGEYESSPAGEHYAYYSEDRNWVLTFQNDKKFSGLVYEDNNSKIHHFTAEDGVMKVDGNVRSYFPGDMKAAGRNLKSEAAAGVDYWDDCHPAQSSGLSELEMGAAVGTVMYNNFGMSQSLAMYNNYFTLSNTIYERQMDIRLSIAETFVATSASDAPWAVSSCTKSIQTQLNDMRFWNPPSQQPLWHLVDDCFGFSGGILGIAYLGVLCKNNNVGVSYYSDDEYNEDQYPTWATVAHEIGHNFDAQHSFEEGQGNTGGIMDYGFLINKLIDGEVQFNSEYREREVCREVTDAYNRGCLVQGVAPSPSGQFTVPEAEETEVFAPKTRDLNCARHRNRVPNGGGHLKKFNGMTRRQCKKECADRENCSGYVHARGGWCELLDSAKPVDLRYSSEFNSYLCAEGELPEALSKKSEDDLLGESNVDALKQECCVTNAHESYLGMNSFYRENLTNEECEAECIQNSRCEAVTFDPVHKACMFYGGADFSHELTSLTGASTLSCDRACISASVTTSSTVEAVHDYAGFVGGFALVAGLVAAAVGVAKWRKQRKLERETVVSPSSTDGAVYQATL